MSSRRPSCCHRQPLEGNHRSMHGHADPEGQAALRYHRRRNPEARPKWYGAPRDPRLRSVTVAQLILMTHRAGFGRREDDPATAAPRRDVLARRPPSQATTHDLMPGVLLYQLEHDPGANDEYTNAGHLLLGIAIEAAAGQDYEDYCSDAVLRPQGLAKARLHPTSGVLGSFGGWACPDRSIWRS